MYILPGGKVEPNEDGLAAAYRELQEESGIKSIDLTQGLRHLMDFTYYETKFQGVKCDMRLEVYVGRLRSYVDVAGDEKELLWVSVNEDFFDMTKFGGEGNIGHMYEQLKLRPVLMQ